VNYVDERFCDKGVLHADHDLGSSTVAVHDGTAEKLDVRSRSDAGSHHGDTHHDQKRGYGCGIAEPPFGHTIEPV